MIKSVDAETLLVTVVAMGGVFLLPAMLACVHGVSQVRSWMRKRVR